jgi:hypothetical protein
MAKTPPFQQAVKDIFIDQEVEPKWYCVPECYNKLMKEDGCNTYQAKSKRPW